MVKSPVAIMSLSEANKCFKHDLKIYEPDLELYSYCKTPIDCAGYIWVKVKAAKLAKVKTQKRLPLCMEMVNKIQESANLKGGLRNILEKHPRLFSNTVGNIEGFQARGCRFLAAVSGGVT